MEAAGAHMVTWANNILVYGGMSRERLEVDALYKWDLSSDTGFQPVAYRYASSPGRQTGGHPLACLSAVPMLTEAEGVTRPRRLCRGAAPPKFHSGQYVAVRGDELWVVRSPRR
jgi:hypothetical protein